MDGRSATRLDAFLACRVHLTQHRCTDGLCRDSKRSGRRLENVTLKNSSIRAVVSSRSFIIDAARSLKRPTMLL